MKLIICISISFLLSSFTFSQNKDKEITGLDSIYNPFIGAYETIIGNIGRVIIMPIDFNYEGTYSVKITDTINGPYSVFYKNHLLFKFELRDGQINGLGYCYYPFLNTVAIQAQFKNGKLDGLVVVQEENGTIIEIMEYKTGIYQRHVFDYEISSKKGLKKRSKHRSDNPLRGDELIIHYTFE